MQATDAPMDDYAAEEQQREQQMLVEAIGERLQGIADERVAKRSTLEQRWLDDLRQWNGEYDSKTQIGAGRSQAFVNLTRKKCTFAESRLAEMLLPTDDRNWSIKPTPMADIDIAQSLAQHSAPQMPPAMGMQQPPQGQPQQPQPQPQAAPVDPNEARQKEADKRALSMLREIDDQLTESDYNAVCRGVIHDAIVLGTGIMKSPTLRNVSKKKIQRAVEMGVETQNIVIEESIKPGVDRVSPWHFFPDPSARRIEESENTLERHLLTRKELKDLAKTPGFSRAAIKELLKESPEERVAGFMDDARIDKTSTWKSGRYEVWEFNGCLPADDAQALGIEIESDSLDEPHLIIWFCNGIVLKAAEHPYADDASIYSIFCWEEDDHSIFGFGMPYRVRHSQRVANSTWRLILDNAALAAVPNIVIDKGLRPQDGRMQLAPGKIWESIPGATTSQNPIQPVQIPLQADMLLGLFDRAVILLEQESGVPEIMQQEGQNPIITQTATGASLQASSASSPLRRLVKQWDDRITRPVIGRMYRWNMEFSDKPEIKGDYDIVALGSSTLVMREQQQQNLINMSQLFASIPPFAQATNWDELQRQIVKGAQITADGIVKSPEELAQAAQQQQQQPNPEQIKVQIEQGKLQLAQQQMQIDAQRGQLDAQVKQAELAMEQQRFQLDTQERQQRMEIERFKAQAEQIKANAIVNDSQLDLQREAMKQRGEMEKLASAERLAMLQIAASKDMTVIEAQKALKMQAIDWDMKSRLFNAEAAIKRSQGSGI
jgi:hypothetical protein